jgi:hypothetical protein
VFELGVALTVAGGALLVISKAATIGMMAVLTGAAGALFPILAMVTGFIFVMEGITGVRTGFSKMIADIRVGGASIGTHLLAMEDNFKITWENISSNVKWAWINILNNFLDMKDNIWIGVLYLGKWINDSFWVMVSGVADAFQEIINIYNLVAREMGWTTLNITNAVATQWEKSAQVYRDAIAKTNIDMKGRHAEQEAAEMEANRKSQERLRQLEASKKSVYDADLSQMDDETRKATDLQARINALQTGGVPGMPPVTPESTGLPGGATGKYSVAGTFSGFAAGGLSGGGVLSRQLQESQKQTQLLGSIASFTGNISEVLTGGVPLS